MAIERQIHWFAQRIHRRPNTDIPVTLDWDNCSKWQPFVQVRTEQTWTFMCGANEPTISISEFSDSVNLARYNVIGGFIHLHPKNLFFALPQDLVQTWRVMGIWTGKGWLVYPKVDTAWSGPNSRAQVSIYTIQIQCGHIETTEDYSRPQWGPPQPPLALSPVFLKCCDPFLL